MKKNKSLLTKILAMLLVTIFTGTSACFSGTTAVVTVTATVLPGQNDISVDTTSLNFGSVSGTVSNRRFVAGPVKVRYFAGTRPWTVRVYTDNPNHVEGLIGVTDPTESMPLKVWCDNYGPIANHVGNPPDEENRYFWRGYDLNGNGTIESPPITSGPDISEANLGVSGLDVNGDGDAIDIITPSPTRDSTIKYPVPEEPVWLRVPDRTAMNPANPYTWRRLTYAGAELDPDGFPVFLGIDVTAVTPQEYRTTTLTFQIIGE